jgi:glycosyltransferase involved in cell wall biosynthesis
MIVYVGNMLSKHGSSINFMELLVPKIESRYPVLAASSKKNKILRLFDMLRVVYVNRSSCQVVFIDTYSTSAFVYAFLVSRLCLYLSIPYVPILHGGNLPNRFIRDQSRVKSFLKEARHIVSPSLYLQDFFSKQGFEVNFIPNFIELDKYAFLKREKVRPKLLWVRAFHSVYNPTLAIETLRLLLVKYPEAELCMVGSSKDDSFHAVASLIQEYKIEKQVRLTGILSKAEWIRLSVEYDIFINTTTIDNMPISVIEAMALGLPVVSTNVGGIPFLIAQQQEGLLVPSGDAEEMKSSIVKLIEQPSFAAELAQHARKKVAAFDWEVVQSKWFDLIQKFE